MTQLQKPARHLTVGQKLILILAAPLFLQLAISLYIATLLEKVEQVAQYEYHSKRVIGTVNWISFLLSSEVLSGLGIILIDDPAYKATYAACQNDLGKAIEELKTAVLQTAEQTKSLSDLERIAKSLSNELNGATKAHGDQEAQAKKLLNSQPLKSFWSEYPVTRHKLLSAERNSFKAGLEQVARFRSEIKFAIYAGACADVLMALAMATIFAVGIARRISAIASNVDRFGKNEPLKEPIGGTDDLAILDNSFHSMAHAVRQAEQHKEEILGMVTHDIRTPLTTVNGILEMLESGIGGTLTDEGRAMVKRANYSCSRILLLTKDLLDIQKLEAGMLTLEKSDVDLREVFKQSTEQVESFAALYDVKVEYQAHEIQVIADPDRLTQIIVNLLTNAIKFSPEGSTVELTATQSMNVTEIAVIDKGKGIPDNMLKDIFERFQQVSVSDATKSGGTGLGLAICKALVELHGGSIHCQSKVQEGSKFWFTIP